MSDNSLEAYLAEHPKLTGALFTIMLLLSQSGTVLASGTSGSAGP